MKTQKLKPILFSTPMVQAILDGRKTQTRRKIKYNKKIEDPEIGFSVFTDDAVFEVRGIHENGEFGSSFFELPIREGDILWVRETFAKVLAEDLNGDTVYGYTYKANDNIIDKIQKWRPSIFMPKEAARIFLEATNVRVERLQDISEEGAIAEGIKPTWINDDKAQCKYKNYINDGRGSLDPVESFKSLWESINGKDSWERNPFVWVYELKQIEKP